MRHQDAVGQLLFDLKPATPRNATIPPHYHRKPDTFFILWASASVEESVVRAAALWRAKRTYGKSVSVLTFSAADKAALTISAASSAKVYLVIDLEHRTDVEEEIAKLSKLFPDLSVLIFAEEPSEIQQDKQLERALKGFQNVAKLRKRPLSDNVGEQGSKPFQFVARTLKTFC
jgi:hypothetical protein